MFIINFRIAFRNLLKHKSFTAINILGLAIGMAACLLILDYVIGEKSVDKFQKNLDNIYRIRNDHYGNNVLAYSGVNTYPAVGPELKTDYPEVQNYARLFPLSESIVSYKEKQFKEEKMYITDPSFFKMFSFPVIQSEDDSLLAAPNMIVMTASMAKKYFGSDPALGKIIDFKVGSLMIPLKVGGIMEDVPENSHLQFTALISYKTLYKINNPDQVEMSWFWPAFATYIQINAAADPRALAAKFPDFIMRHNGKQLTESHQKEIFFLEPMKDIYLHSSVSGQLDRSGNGMAVYALSIIAIFILVIAWVNYINLTTAKSINRAKEVGVRKVVGAAKSQLIKQFLSESALINMVAVILSVAICQLALPFFNALIGRTGGANISLWQKPYFWITLLILLLAGSILSGLYPAFVLSSFNPVKALKSKTRMNRNFGLRKVLVVFQFTCSVALIAGTFIIFRQISFMRNKDLGVQINNTLVIPTPIAHQQDSAFYAQNDVFKNEILHLPIVDKLSISSSVPGKQTGQSGGYIRRIESPATDVHNFKTIMVDEDFFSVFKNQFITGRNFSKEIGSDKKGVVITASASRLLGYESPEKALGRKIIFFGDDRDNNEYQVIGVIKDYHQQSLKSNFDPIIFGYSKDPQYYSLSIHASPAGKSDNAAQLKGLISELEKKWKILYPGNPFRYFFLDESFNQLYKKDQQFGNVFGIFSCLAIFVASLGLLGLASFTTIQRTKEIGIRKVLGAGINNILVLLSRDFIKLVGLASLIAVPVTWFLMKKWLDGYAFRIPLSWPLFVLPAIAVLAIAVVTVSYQTLRTALSNPVNSLRSE
ncbi:MAG: ABC transporter permease [Flavitalea sp.]